MKLPPIMDAEDIQVAFQALVYAVIVAVLVVGVAATAGLAWTVFRIAGGL